MRAIGRGCDMDAEPARFLATPESDSPAEAAFIPWLEAHAQRPENREALAHWEILPARPARHGALALPLPPALAEALEGRGIDRLYTHQVQAIEALRGGLDTVVVTGTASGKSLCYHLPVLERLLGDPEATALYLFPTKALAQDQLKGLSRLAMGHPELARSTPSSRGRSSPASTTATRSRRRAASCGSRPT